MVVGIRPIVRMWGLGLWEVFSVGGLSKGSSLRMFPRKNTENSEQLGRQARLRMNLAPPVYQFEH